MNENQEGLKRIRGVKLSYSKDIDADAPIMGLLTTVVDLKPETAYAKPEWREAMELHLENLTNLNVFSLVKKPKGKTIIKARWVCEERRQVTFQVQGPLCRQRFHADPRT